MTASVKVALVAMNVPGYSSLALGYLRAYAQADARLSDSAFITFDFSTDVDPWWAAYQVLALDPSPDVIGFSVMCWNATRVFETARIVKSVRPEMVVVLGGPEVGPIAEQTLAEQAAVDAVVRGEGEATFADLLASLAEGSDLTAVPGVSTRDPHGAIVSSPDRELIADLDSIPSPYLTGVMRPGEDGTYLETYRGCPHRCSYCYEGKGYDRIRHFSAERVAAEIDFATSQPQVRSISFIDPVFNLNSEHLSQLTECLAPHARRGLRLRTIEVDIERISPVEAAAFKRAGVASVETGPQTVGSVALAGCRRTFDPERFAAGVSALKAEGISVECDLIIGLPGDTQADVAAGLAFAIGLDPGRVQLSTLHVLPGTDIWRRADELGVRYDATAPHEVISTEQMSYTELRQAEVFGTAAVAIYMARVVRPPAGSTADGEGTQ